jgi:hypothetical protein
MSQSLLASRRFAPFFWSQALGALNDNLVKNALVILVTFGIAGLSDGQRLFYVNLAAGLFILPFFLFSATSGQVAEKYEKSALIRQIKLLEIGISLLAALGFWLQSPVLLLAVLFLLGAQSALFGPVKYAILPQHLKPDELIGGNAWVEAGTFVAILLGTIVGGWLITLPQGGLLVGAAAIACAVLGWLSARGVPVAPAAAPELVIHFNFWGETWRNLRFLGGNRTVFLSILGISWFWFYGAVLLSQLPALSKISLGGTESVVTLLLTLFSFGIGIGSLLCEKLSGKRVELGLVPLGSIGLTVFGVDVFFALPLAAGQGLTAMQLLQDASYWRFLADITLIGVFGGFYIVPLYALVQTRSEATHRSRIIAGNNILNAAFMVVAAVLSLLLLQAGLSVPQLLLTLAVMNAAVAVFIYSLVPEFAMRFVVWLLMGALYKVEVRGADNIPQEGAVIVAANHVSFVDALLLGGYIRRPVRFVSYHKIYNIPFLKPIFKAAKAIPIAPAKEDPVVLARAYERMDEVLVSGEVLGIFPEGGLTPDGSIQPFKPGIERILAKTPVPVVPIAVQGLWQSMWSRRDGKMGRSRLPRRFRARIQIVIGAPMAGAGLTAAELEAAVKSLRGDQS